DDDARVPPFAQGANGPIAQRLRGQRSGQEREEQRRLELPCFHGACDEEQGMEHDHHPVVDMPDLDPAARERAGGIAASERKLEQPLADERDQIGAGHHSSSTSSAQKPGPIASSSPSSPFFACPLSSNSESTKRTEAEDRLPTSRKLRHERSRAPSGNSSAASNALSTFGPPVWAIQWRIRERVDPCRSRK